LIEVTMALGLAALCLTTLMGLIPVGLRSSQSASEQCSASSAAAILISDLKIAQIASTGGKVDGLTIPVYSGTPLTTGTQTIYYSDQIGTTGSQSGSHFSGQALGARYQFSVVIQTPNSPVAAENVDIRVSWPAVANPATADGVMETVCQLNIN